MSLINDALKRAKAAQQHAQALPPSAMQFRPVEPGQKTKPRLDWLAPAAVAIIGIFALLFVWPWMHKSVSSQPLETKARTLYAAKEAPPAPAAAPAAPQPTQEIQASAPTESAAVPSVNPASVPEPPAPQPPPLRLQAIVCHPTRPSAIINGRTLFIGDKVGGLRVTAITQESATLIGSGQTNILTLIP